MYIDAIDINGQYHQVPITDITWRPSVYGIVFDGDRVLLSPQHGKGYDLPGGGVDMNESFENALIREVKEETGIDVAVKKVLAVRDNYFKVTFREPQETWHSVMVYYLCEKIGGELSMSNFDEHEKSYAQLAEWIDLSRLDSIVPAASYDYREIIRMVM